MNNGGAHVNWKIAWLFQSIAISACIVLTAMACDPVTRAPERPDPALEVEAILNSWNDSESRRRIIEFVDAVTDPDNQEYVSPEDRIAVFDNDGTLWAEKPMYFQLFYALDNVRQQQGSHPEWREQQPFKAIIENDSEAMRGFGMKEIGQLIAATHAGMTTDQFDRQVKQWIDTARHPDLGKPYNTLIYQPMLELIDYLHLNDFKVFIVSGGGIDFMRVWAYDAYGIPEERIIGSSLKAEFRDDNGEYSIVKLPDLDFIDDKEGKPVGIHKFIGKRPIAAFGNSDGDLQMLQWTAAGPGRRLAAFVHHTDGEREWVYDRDSHVGQLNKGLDEAKASGWVLIDMSTDWALVFPDEG